jgi:hypothetical protein
MAQAPPSSGSAGCGLAEGEDGDVVIVDVHLADPRARMARSAREVWWALCLAGPLCGAGDGGLVLEVPCGDDDDDLETDGDDRVCPLTLCRPEPGKSLRLVGPGGKLLKTTYDRDALGKWFETQGALMWTDPRVKFVHGVRCYLCPATRVPCCGAVPDLEYDALNKA